MSKGRNINSNAVASTNTFTLNSVTATTISGVNLERMSFSATIKPGITNVDVFIRYYPALTDDVKQGADVLTRRVLGNDNLFRPNMKMDTDNIYTGEISAITDIGTTDVTVTEY